MNQAPRATGKHYLQNRYQDDGWQDLNESFIDEHEAIAKAIEYSKDGICYGMVRVIEPNGNILKTYVGGGHGEEAR